MATEDIGIVSERSRGVPEFSRMFWENFESIGDFSGIQLSV